MDSTRPVGQVDRHIQLMVHGVAQAGVLRPSQAGPVKGRLSTHPGGEGHMQGRGGRELSWGVGSLVDGDLAQCRGKLLPPCDSLPPMASCLPFTSQLSIPLIRAGVRCPDEGRRCGAVAGTAGLRALLSCYLPAGPEITDELVKVLRRRLDEATLDIITVMLVRNCKLTPADVEVPPPALPLCPVQPSLSSPSSCCSHLLPCPWESARSCLVLGAACPSHASRVLG